MWSVSVCPHSGACVLEARNFFFGCEIWHGSLGVSFAWLEAQMGDTHIRGLGGTDILSWATFVT